MNLTIQEQELLVRSALIIDLDCMLIKMLLISRSPYSIQRSYRIFADPIIFASISNENIVHQMQFESRKKKEMTNSIIDVRLHVPFLHDADFQRRFPTHYKNRCRVCLRLRSPSTHRPRHLPLCWTHRLAIYNL